MAQITLSEYTPRYIPNGNEIAVFDTSKGTIRVALDGKNMSLTVGNFIELSRRGFYKDTKFHGYKEDSVVAGGCPLTRHLGPAQVLAAVRGSLHGIHPGTGDARYTIKDEWNDNPSNHHEHGSLCMAHKSDPNSGSSQFYFSLAEQPDLDEKFGVFGKTIEGLEVVKSLRIGDAIKDVWIEGADEGSLEEAVSYEPPKPVSVKEIYEGKRGEFEGQSSLQHP